MSENVSRYKILVKYLKYVSKIIPSTAHSWVTTMESSENKARCLYRYASVRHILTKLQTTWPARLEKEFFNSYRRQLSSCLQVGQISRQCSVNEPRNGVLYKFCLLHIDTGQCSVPNDPQLLNVSMTLYWLWLVVQTSQQDWNVLLHLSHVYFPRAQSRSTSTSSILAMCSTAGLDSVLVLDLLTYLAAEVCVFYSTVIFPKNIFSSHYEASQMTSLCQRHIHYTICNQVLMALFPLVQCVWCPLSRLQLSTTW